MVDSSCHAPSNFQQHYKLKFFPQKNQVFSNKRLFSSHLILFFRGFCLGLKTGLLSELHRIVKNNIFLFLNENVCCDPTVQPSHQDSSNEESQCTLLCKNIESLPLIIPANHSYLKYCVVSYIY